MKYNMPVKLFTVSTIPNGVGGFSKQEELFGTIKGYLTPAKISTFMSENGLLNYSTRKVFTKAEIPDNINIEYIEYAGVKYHVINFADYGKIKMFEIEVSGIG